MADNFDYDNAYKVIADLLSDGVARNNKEIWKATLGKIDWPRNSRGEYPRSVVPNVMGWMAHEGLIAWAKKPHGGGQGASLTQKGKKLAAKVKPTSQSSTEYLARIRDLEERLAREASRVIALEAEIARLKAGKKVSRDAKDLILIDEVREIVGGMARQYLYRLMKAGRFPKPVGTRHNVHNKVVSEWSRREIEAWVKENK